MKRLLPVLLLGLAACQHHGCPPAAPRQKIQLFVFAGQSNMTGFPPYDTQVSHDARMIFLNDPLNGPAVPFLEAYLGMNPSNTVASLQFASGGTNIWQWSPGGGGIYEGMIPRVRKALQDNPNMELAGFVFSQGECDASQNCPHRTEDWKDAFSGLITTFRADTGTDVPVVFMQIASHDPVLYPAIYWKDIQDQQAHVALRGTIMVKTDDLARRDGVHLTDASYAIAGQRMASALNHSVSPCEETDTFLGMSF